MQPVWLFPACAAAALLAVVAHRRWSRRSPQALRRSMLQPLAVSDYHWDLVRARHDFTDFQPEEFADILEVLQAAQNTLAYAPDGRTPELPALADIGLWDTSDDSGWDFVMAVEVNRLVSVSSASIRIRPFTELGDGQAGARTVLTELIGERNHLLACLAHTIPA